MQDPAAALRQFFDDASMSRIDAGKYLGCNPSFVSLLVTGRRLPGLKVAVRIQQLTKGRVRCEDWVPADEAVAA